MAFIAIGLLIGIIIGLNLTYTIPIEYIKYTAVAIIGMVDALFGAMKAKLTKEEEYEQSIFLTGLGFNIILALGITLLGEKLGLDLYLAVTVVFTFRIFANLGASRREIIKKIVKKRKYFF
ncbi:MAG: small basic family protein [Nitrospirota bacterium]